MYSFTNQPRTQDQFSPSAIRGDMMKVQKQIHRINTQFSQAAQLIPSNLPNTLQSLMRQMQILNAQVEAETKYNYSGQIASLEKKINDLNQLLLEHENESKNQENRKEGFNQNSILDLEKDILTSNNLFLEKLHEQIVQKFKNDASQQDNDNNSSNQKKFDLHLSANFPYFSKSETENSNEQNNQIIQIETSSKLDPGIHLRVQRHSERIRLVEDAFDNLLSNKLPEILLQNQLQQISSIAEINKKQIEELDKKYCDFESTIRDIKQERQAKIEKKLKMKEAQNIPGAVTFSEFTEFSNSIFKKFSDLSSEISFAENEVESSIFDLNEHLNSIDLKINEFNQSASDFESLIKLTDRKFSESESKIQKKNKSVIPEDSEEKLKRIAEVGNKKITKLSKEIREKINDVKELISDLQSEGK